MRVTLRNHYHLYSSGWKNLRELKTGSREFLEGEDATKSDKLLGRPAEPFVIECER